MPKHARSSSSSSSSLESSSKLRKTEHGAVVPGEDHARSMIKSFEGLIRHTKTDLNKMGDIKGDYTSFYPKTSSDVQKVIQLSAQLGQNLIVRSGIKESRSTKEDGNNSFVLNLNLLKSCELKPNNLLVVQAGVTNEMLSHVLVEKNLFLPISDHPNRCVLSSTLSNDPGFFALSAGTLKDFVACATYTTADAVDLQAENLQLEAVLKGEVEGAVITELTFNVSVPADNFWMRRFSFVYQPSNFEKLVHGIFEATDLPKCDLLVRLIEVAPTGYVVNATVAGSGEETAADECINCLRTMAPIKRVFLQQEDLQDETGNPFGVFSITSLRGVDIVQAIGGMKMGFENCNKYDTLVPMKGAGEDRDTEEFIKRYLDSVSRVIARDMQQPSNDLDVHTKLCLSADHRIRVFADVSFFTEKVSGREKSLLRHLGSIVNPVKRFMDRLDRFWDRLPSDIKSLLHDSEPAKPIPNFQGNAYDQDDPQYPQAAHQYASSSYPGKPWLQPKIVAYPVDAQDIAIAIKFAKDNNLKIMTRSGGHQYCGLSSGDKDTIVLSMDHFNSVQVTDRSGLAVVGPGSKLINVATVFKEHHVTAPHGECPWVCVGGHVQTGGFGHILRSFGCLLDHVQYFKIVLASGREETIVKPGLAAPTSTVDQETNDILYKSVLGGGPGSFGVVTQLAFQAIRDVEHPYSAGYGATFATINPFKPDQLDIERFKAIMQEVKLWTEGKWTSPKGSQEELPKDVDVMMSAIGGSFKILNLLGTRPTAILLEMVYGNVDGSEGENYGPEPFKAFTEKVWNTTPDVLTLPIEKSTKDLPRSERGLSYWSREFVRDPMLRTDGREFELPYKKRVQCTNFPLTDAFVQGFVERCNKAQNTDGINIVYQMAIGGGAYKTYGEQNITGLNHRGFAHQLVFDIFYDTSRNKKAEQEAEALQRDMKEFLLENYSRNEDIRMIWGSFDESPTETEETNLANAEVVKWYYDNEKKYNGFQAVKRKVDPDDLFHNRFTVQQPQN